MILELKNIDTGYGKKQVLFGLSLDVKKGEIVAVIGPNGSGKSTILKTTCGLIPVWNGDIFFNGKSINGSTPPENVRRGITFAPQGNRIFDEMTVFENLEIGGFHFSKSVLKERIDEVIELFPVLKEKHANEAGNLSGGEQQMLALARSLIPKPKLLMLDEPSLGLSPDLVNSVFRKMTEINKGLGISILIVEQKVKKVLEISNRVYSLKLGKIAFTGFPSELLKNKEKLRDLFL